ncbi:MAG: hypothetical protein JWM42_1909 [Burkholderia sp.]|nr:hypothetical protein [Burkholderia sp.]
MLALDFFNSRVVNILSTLSGGTEIDRVNRHQRKLMAVIYEAK